MRLKEIKPGMAVHCKSDDEKKALLEEAERLGYVWYSTKNKPTERSVSGIGNTIHFYDAGTSSFSADYKHITHSCQTGDSVIEFSDLVISEMTAEEVMEWFREYYIDSPVIEEVFGEDYSMSELLETYTPKEICDHISDWKSDHEKKEPEIKTEWFWQGRIFKIEKDGGYYQIKDGNGFYDTGCKYRDDAEEYMEDKLKEHCKTNDGEFIAVVEHVCRVRAVE